MQSHSPDVLTPNPTVGHASHRGLSLPSPTPGSAELWPGAPGRDWALFQKTSGHLASLASLAEPL